MNSSLYESLYDPREEFVSRPELPSTIEGAQKFHRWQEVLLDLDDLPVEEYMKPMPVNVVSGGTSPTPPGPTPSGTTYDVSFVASGNVITSYKVSSGKKATLVPAAPELSGFTFDGWIPDPAETIITENTTFNAVYTYTGETSTNMYYGLTMVLSGAPFDASVLESCDINEFQVTAEYKIPASQEYADKYALVEDEEITEKEFWTWYNETFAPNNQYVTRIVVPKNRSVLSSTDEMGQPYIVTENPVSVTIEGEEYYCYDISSNNNVFVPTEVDLQIKETITIG